MSNQNMSVRSHDQITEYLRKDAVNELVRQDSASGPKEGKNRTVSLWLAPVDYPEECAARRTILKGLKNGGVILDYQIVLEKIRYKGVRHQVPSFSPLQREMYPEETFDDVGDPYRFEEEDMMVAKITYDPRQLKAKLRKYHPGAPIVIRSIKLGRNSIVVNGTERVDFELRRGSKDALSKEFRVFMILFRIARSRSHNHYIPSKRKTPHYSLDTLKEETGSPSIKALVQTIKRLRTKFRDRKLPIEFYVSEKKRVVSMVIRKEGPLEKY